MLDKERVALIDIRLDYGKFLEGEAQLELYLQQYPLIVDDHVENARKTLTRVEDLLRSCRSFESECLLGKLCYAQGRYDQCRAHVDAAIRSIPEHIEEQPHRSSLLLAEIYALKGLLLERQREDPIEIIQSFDHSCQLSQTFYAAVEKSKHLSNDNLDIENSLVELAYQRLPLLHASTK